MVQRYRLWRSRGEELGNPFDEDDALCNYVCRLPSPPLSDESSKRNDNEADDDDDESIVEA